MSAVEGQHERRDMVLLLGGRSSLLDWRGFEPHH